MNRRNFFKIVTGFVAGVFATSAIAKEKPKLTVAMLQKAKKELDNETAWQAKTWIATREQLAALGRGDCRYQPIMRDKIEGDYWEGMELVRYQELADGTLKELWRQKF